MASCDGKTNSTENRSEIDRMYRQFTFKCLQIVAQSRIERAENVKDKVKYENEFSLRMPTNTRVDEQIKKSLAGLPSYPCTDQSVCVEVSLVTDDGDVMFLETWHLTFDPSSVDVAVNKPQHIYTRMGVTLKSLLSVTRVTPAFRLAKDQGDRGGGFKLATRFYLGKPQTHLLGDGFKTRRAGAVPSNSGLLAVSVSYRTVLLLSPNMTQTRRAGIEMRDNHYSHETRVRKSHHTSPSPPHHASPSPPHRTSYTARRVSPQEVTSPRTKPTPVTSTPQPCSLPHKSPDRDNSPYCFAVSPGADRDEDFLQRAHLAVRDDQWSPPSPSLFTMDDLPEPVIGAFSELKPRLMPDENPSPLYQGLLRRSQIAQQEMVATLTQQRLNQESNMSAKSSDRLEYEKENIPLAGRLHTQEVDEDFIMQKPPFAEDEDPNDVKSFLGLIFQAPKLSFEGADSHLSVEEFVHDVSRLVDKSEGDMAELDKFCQSVVSQGREERDTSPHS